MVKNVKMELLYIETDNERRRQTLSGSEGKYFINKIEVS
jgi:hypothetical protein